MVRTKNMYDDCGTIKSIESNGMGAFVYKNGDVEETLQIAEKCKVGDRVVKLAGKARPFFIIPSEEWKNMPASEKESKTITAKENTPQLENIAKRLEALEAENKALKAAQNKLAQNKPAENPGANPKGGAE